MLVAEVGSEEGGLEFVHTEGDVHHVLGLDGGKVHVDPAHSGQEGEDPGPVHRSVGMDHVGREDPS